MSFGVFEEFRRCSLLDGFWLSVDNQKTKGPNSNLWNKIHSKKACRYTKLIKIHALNVQFLYVCLSSIKLTQFYQTKKPRFSVIVPTTCSLLVWLNFKNYWVLLYLFRVGVQCAIMCVSEDNLQELVLFFYLVSSENWTWVVRFGSKCP